MKLEDFLRQNIDHLNNPMSSEGPFAHFLDGIIKFPLLSTKIFFIGKFPGIVKGIFFFFIFLGLANVYPIVPTDIDFIVFKIFIWVLNLYLYLVLFFILLYFFARFSKDNRYRKKIVKKHKKLHHGHIKFSSKQYKRATEVLREFNPLLPKNAYKKYGEDIIDILILTNVIYLYERKLKRLVSIRSIEEDREAGPDDD